MKTYKFIPVFVLCLVSIFSQAQIRNKISINPDDIKSYQIQEFEQVIWQSDYKTDETGKPELPFYRVSYVLPIDAKLTGITFRSKEKQLFKKGIYIYPAQPPIPVGYSEDVKFVEPDNAVYDSDTPYPQKLYDIEFDGIMQGYHVVTIRFYPFEYIPESRILNYYSNMEYMRING
jgi:hypothetical protein